MNGTETRYFNEKFNALKNLVTEIKTENKIKWEAEEFDLVQALSFDGSDDWVRLPLDQVSPITIELWAKAPTQQNDKRLIIYTDGDNSGNWATAIKTDSNGNIQARTFDGGEKFVTSSHVLDDKLTHIALTAENNDKIKLYINGDFIGETDIGTMWAAGDRFLLSRWQSTYFGGKLADVRIWNTTRTQQQIQDNMFKRLEGNETGLVGYWKLDDTYEDSGDTFVEDLAGDNDGEVIGAELVDAYVTRVENYTHVNESDVVIHLGDFAFKDDFDGTSLDTDKWEAYGTDYGSISVSDGEVTITNSTGSTSGNIIGIRTLKTFPVGAKFEAKIRHTAGQHAAVIAFGESPYYEYIHGSPKNIGALIYSRVSDACRSYRDEDDSNGWTVISSSKLTDNTVKIVRVSSTTVELYIDGDLKETLTNKKFENDYSMYFTAGGNTTPCTLVIEWAKVYYWDKATNDNDIPDVTGDLTGKFLWRKQLLKTAYDGSPKLSSKEILIKVKP